MFFHGSGEEFPNGTDDQAIVDTLREGYNTVVMAFNTYNDSRAIHTHNQTSVINGVVKVAILNGKQIKCFDVQICRMGILM